MIFDGSKFWPVLLLSGQGRDGAIRLQDEGAFQDPRAACRVALLVDFGFWMRMYGVIDF